MITVIVTIINYKLSHKITRLSLPTVSFIPFSAVMLLLSRLVVGTFSRLLNGSVCD